MTYLEKNASIWDRRSENNDRWSVPVSGEEIRRARAGDWQIVLTPTRPVPADWFPESLAGKRILCLASGGGQQGPILAAAGAEVTVLDNSRVQLEKDASVARRAEPAPGSSAGIVPETVRGIRKNRRITHIGDMDF